MEHLVTIGTIAGIILLAIVIVGLVFSRLYKKSSKEITFVRTGFGGEKVILNGGAIVLPVLHEIIHVNMNTVRLEVSRKAEQSLITKDRMRVDAQVDFYVCVNNNGEAIARAAQTLGQKTMNPEALKGLVEGKFVDALRSVAANMTMEDLHEQRADFVQQVQQAATEELSKNGLLLESCSLVSFDQTDFKFFNPQNIFDAEGLTKLTETIEDRRKKRNGLEQDADLAIKTKNLETEQARLKITREEEYAKMEQTRELSIRKAEQQALIAKEESEKSQQANEARIESERNVELKRIESERDIETGNIQRTQAIQRAQVEQKKIIEIAEQDREIAIAEKSQAESEAKALADEARAKAVAAEEAVVTVRETQRAERAKTIELVEAKQLAEKQAIAITVAAEAEKKSANDKAEAITIAAQAKAEAGLIEAKAEAEKKSVSITIIAEAEKKSAQAKADAVFIEAKASADAKMVLASAIERQYTVDAEGRRALNESDNTLSDAQVQMKIKLELIKALPEIIAQSVKPMEKIETIKILQVDGGHMVTSNGAVTVDGTSTVASMPDQLVNSALRYRTQAPLVDSLMNELGIKGGDISSFTNSLTETK